MVKIRVAGLASFTIASAQSIAHNSADTATSTPAAQTETVTELAHIEQDDEGIQHVDEQSNHPNDTLTSTILVATITVNAVVNVPEVSTGASFTYVPPTTTSWPTFSFEPVTTPDATLTYVPTTTNDISLKPATIQDALFTYVPIITEERGPATTTEEQLFVFAPSATEFVYVPGPTTADFVPVDFSHSSVAEQSAVTTVQPEVGLNSSAVTSDASYSLETVQTMVEAPTLDTPTWALTTSWAAMPTPIVNAPPAEHSAINPQPLPPAQPTPAQPDGTLRLGPDTASQPEQQNPPGSAHVRSQDAPAPAPPAHHEPTQALPTTQRIVAHPAPSAIHSETFSSVSTTMSSASETSKAALQTAQDPAPVPTVYALTYQGQTVHLSGITLAAGPTGSRSDVGDSSTSSGGTVDSAAVVAYTKSSLLLLMALAMTVVAW